MASDLPTVVAVAGRRVDAPDSAPPRFPSSSLAAVEAAVKALFREQATRAMVASAACGADIVALEAARDLGLRSRIILPFERARFRETSVVDRGAAWGPRFDRLIDDADAQNDLVVLHPPSGDDDAAYAAVTTRIIEETLLLARTLDAQAIALALWDEKPRTTVDATKAFIEQAVSAGLVVQSIRTT